MVSDSILRYRVLGIILSEKREQWMGRSFQHLSLYMECMLISLPLQVQTITTDVTTTTVLTSELTQVSRFPLWSLNWGVSRM